MRKKELSACGFSQPHCSPATSYSTASALHFYSRLFFPLSTFAHGNRLYCLLCQLVWLPDGDLNRQDLSANDCLHRSARDHPDDRRAPPHVVGIFIRLDLLGIFAEASSSGNSTTTREMWPSSSSLGGTFLSSVTATAARCSQRWQLWRRHLRRSQVLVQLSRLRPGRTGGAGVVRDVHELPT